jgi:phage terminase small subunit
MKGAKPELGNVLPYKGDTKRPVPPAPDFMSEEGRRVWTELAPALVAKDRLDPIYEINFASYCEAAADFIRFTGELAAFGSYFETQTRNGKQEKHRAPWKQRQEAVATMMRWSAVFGLTPVDEKRVGLAGQGDLFEDLMKQLNGGH